jgi:16S rRNA (uracil1498-N3)-methyltransferase
MTQPTTGPHFLVAPGDVQGDRAVLRGEDARHLAVVLRARPGSPVSLADGTGTLYRARVRGTGDEVVLDVEAAVAVPVPVPHLTVVHALPRGRKFDDIVQRLSEVGVDRLVPAVSARTQVRLDEARGERAVRRWRAVAHAAAKQSRRARALEVPDPVAWAAAFPTGARGAVLWEDATVPLRAVLPDDAADLVLGIGPEGGLTADEVTAAGVPAASLGPTVLRTETAALVAAAAVLTLRGRLA